MTFREDNCQICDPTTVRNFALLHNIAINLVTGPFLKPVYKVNARRPPWNDGYMQQLLKVNFMR